MNTFCGLRSSSYPNRVFHVGILLGSLAGSTVALGQTIFVKPGQCVQVGAQQICAQITGSEGTAGDSNPIVETVFNCRLGEYKDSEFPNLKTHALFKVYVYKDGKKVETQLQNFGLHGKDACEKERRFSQEKSEKIR